MPPHKSLRDRLEELLTHHAEPRFEMTSDPVLQAFGQIFLDSGLVSFDANKHLRPDALAPIYDCETESRGQTDTDPERFVVSWAPVWQKDSPLTGFRTGGDSAFVGSTPTIAMPQDERTAALLLLVTTTFVHLSGVMEADRCIIRGAAENDDGNYRFLELSDDALPTAERVPGAADPSELPASLG